MYAKAITILLKGHFPISLLPPSKVTGTLSVVRKVIQTTNKDYDLVLSHIFIMI